MAVAKSIGAVRVARQATVCADGYRSPQVELLLGRDGVVQHLDNGIRSGHLTNVLTQLLVLLPVNVFIYIYSHTYRNRSSRLGRP